MQSKIKPNPRQTGPSSHASHAHHHTKAVSANAKTSARCNVASIQIPISRLNRKQAKPSFSSLQQAAIGCANQTDFAFRSTLRS